MVIVDPEPFGKGPSTAAAADTTTTTTTTAVAAAADSWGETGAPLPRSRGPNTGVTLIYRHWSFYDMKRVKFRSKTHGEGEWEFRSISPVTQCTARSPHQACSTFFLLEIHFSKNRHAHRKINKIVIMG